MKEFTYTIKDEQGIHARPASILAKEAKKYESSITISKGEKTVDVTRLMAVMGLCVKCGQDVRVEIDGADEEAAFEGKSIKKWRSDFYLAVFKRGNENGT